MRRLLRYCAPACLSLLAAGCYSPYHTDRGALFGGVTGAGIGAIVGDQVGNAAGGAAVGAGIGALTGAVVGEELDEIEARNQALIEAKLGRPLGPGAVSPDAVIELTQAGVGDEVIINHIRANGLVGPLDTTELIRLKEHGVSDRVISSMQTLEAGPPPPVATSPPVIVQEHYYGPPFAPGCYHPYPHHRFARHRRRPRLGWSVHVGH